MYQYTIKDIPPSNNKYMGKNAKGFHFSYQKEKRRWEWFVIAAVGQNKPPKPIDGAIVELHYYFPTKHRRDPDNYSGKMILDGLVRSKVIYDDSFNCIDLVLKGHYDKDNPRTEIVIRERK